ncbi:MAG: coniferyl aldehyde dehydrogenase [Steroidobacteraceae bacterium]
MHESATRKPVLQVATAQQLEVILREQQAAMAADRFPHAAARRERLAAVERMLLDHEESLSAAISADFGHRSPLETRLLEFFPTMQNIRHARAHLAGWMQHESRPVSKWFFPGRAEVRHQPLGVVGIAAPWNYPLYLTLVPLADALAAGNRAMIKPSEHSPRFASLLARLIAERFPRSLVHVVEGDLDTARAFTALPFDHLVFTGSTAVAHEVMAAAARTLTPVTLELGGKSPVIVGRDFNLESAARRILYGKVLNAGQTCVAPDYVLAPAEAIAPLVAYMRIAAQEWYGAAPEGYTSIASRAHYTRLLELLDDARVHGARIEQLLPQDVMPAGRLAPLVLLNAKPDMRVMREEIFGPILPILPYRTLEEAIGFVNARERPLALYLFENDAARRDHVLEHTSSGGVTVNDTVLHAAQASLPFGGVGASGTGRYHGLDGFKAFSQIRAVFHQRRWNLVPLLHPPYGRMARALLRWMLRS